MTGKKVQRAMLQKQLDQCAERWYRLKMGNGEGNVQEAYFSMFMILDQLENTLKYKNRGEEAYVAAFQEVLQKYDPDKGPFSHYFNFVLARRKNETYTVDSLDRVIDESGENHTTVGDLVQSQEPRQEDIMEQQAQMRLQAEAMILHFTERRKGKQVNENKRLWYRLFFTEDLTRAAKALPERWYWERDLFSAVKTGYLDYYMTEICRTMAEINQTPLKPYCEVVPDAVGRTEETPLKLPADVSINYLRLREGISVSRSARSNQMAEYKKERDVIWGRSPATS